MKRPQEPNLTEANQSKRGSQSEARTRHTAKMVKPLWGNWWMIWGHTAKEEDRQTGKRITNYFRIIIFFLIQFFLQLFHCLHSKLLIHVYHRSRSQQVTAACSLFTHWQLNPTLKQFLVHLRRAHSHPLAHLPTPLPLPRGCSPALEAQREEV